MADDRYAMLRPPGPTPANEICSCSGTPAVKLMSVLGHNPVACVACNLEVAPERLELPPKLVEAIAHWRSVQDALYRLWLDSGAYQEWAAGELRAIASPANRLGRAVQGQLNRLRRCYYWYFQDESAADFAPISKCPSCGGEMQPYEGGVIPQRACEECSILCAGP